MKITGQLEWTDYLKAQFLHMRPSTWIRVLRYVGIAFLVMIFGGYAILALLGRDQAASWVFLSPVFVIAALFLLYIYVFIPWQVRRVFEQQKELSAPFEHEITPAGLISTSQYGNSNRPWSSFHKWKEDKDILLLYLSDVAFVMFPKRLCTAEQLAALHAQLQENNVLEASKVRSGRLVVLLIYFAILIIVGLISYFAARGSTP